MKRQREKNLTLSTEIRNEASLVCCYVPDGQIFNQSETVAFADVGKIAVDVSPVAKLRRDETFRQGWMLKRGGISFPDKISVVSAAVTTNPNIILLSRKLTERTK